MIIDQEAFLKQVEADPTISDYEADWLDLMVKLHAIYQDEYPDREVQWTTVVEDAAMERGYRLLH